MLVRLRRLQNIYPKALQNTQYLIPHILVRLTYSNPEQFRLDTREKYLTHHQQPFRLVQAYISAKLLWCHNSALFKIFSYAYYRIPLIAAKSYRDIGYSDVLSALQITADELISIEASLFDASVNSWDVNIKNQPTDNRLRIMNNNDSAQDVYINLLIFYR